MAVTSGFFNSVNHDRLYDAEQLSSIFDGIITDGVYENFGDGLRTTAVSTADNMVSVGTGRAWFDHTWSLNDTPLTIEIEPANEMVSRIDAIVIDVDRTKDVRETSIIYLKGPVAEGDPKPPAFVNEDLHKQYPICYINRTPGATGPVSQTEIEYAVGTEKCPAITGVLEAQNLDALWQQLDAEFNEWWDNIRDMIGGDDPVLNLQNQIDELREYVDEQLESATSMTGLLEKPVAELFASGNYNLNVRNFSVGTSLAYTGSYNTLIPDGQLLFIGCKKTTGNLYNIFSTEIFSKDGVSKGTTDHYTWPVTTEGDNGMPSNYTGYQKWGPSQYNSSAVLAHCGGTSFDSFPITLYVVSLGADYKFELTQSNPDVRSYHEQYGIGLNKLTISSDSVVMYSKTDMIYSGYSSGGTSDGYSYMYPSFLTSDSYIKTDSGSSIIVFINSLKYSNL